jgi:hypothetical protein
MGGWHHSLIATVQRADDIIHPSLLCIDCGSYLSSLTPPLNPNPGVFLPWAVTLPKFCLDPAPAPPSSSMDSNYASACCATVVHGDLHLAAVIWGLRPRLCVLHYGRPWGPPPHRRCSWRPPPCRPLGASAPSAAHLPLPALTMLTCSRTAPSAAPCARPWGWATGDLVHRATPSQSHRRHR